MGLVSKLYRAKEMVQYLLFSISLGALFSGLVRAQATATISGRAMDASGAAIPGASITVKDLETGATRVVSADESGSY